MTIFNNITETSNIPARHDAEYWREAMPTDVPLAGLFRPLIRILKDLFVRASRPRT